MLRTLFAPVLLLAVGCAPDAPPTGDGPLRPDPLDMEVLEGLGWHRPGGQPRIINGLPPDELMHESVVSLHQLANGGTSVYVFPFCSGTLIYEEPADAFDPDGSAVILTAAHCLDTSGGGPNFKTMNPADLAIYVGDNPTVGNPPDVVNHLYQAIETVIHPGYDRLALRNDLALVRISAEVSEAGIVPPLPARLGLNALDIGAPNNINFAGFGDDENGDYGVKLQADGTLASIGCGVTGCPDPGDGPTQISYEQASAGPCFGDSGGPAFIQRCRPYVAGITSYGDQNCNVYGVSTRPDAFEDWIVTWIGTVPTQIPPTADAGGPHEVLVGETVDYDGAASWDLDGNLISWEWSFRDGATASGPSVSHAFTAPGVYWVLLTVMDDDCMEHSAVAKTTVSLPPNTPPTADAGGPYAGVVGVPVSFDGAASSDPDGVIVDWQWSFRDGTSGSGETVDHTYDAPGTYWVLLTVTDDRGDQDTVTTRTDIDPG